jgi:GT2 family glycosyltransferase
MANAPGGRFDHHPCYNQAEYTRRCLDALRENTPDAIGHEIVLVDNGSTDDTPDLLAGMNDSVQVITNSANRGFAVACNQGAPARARNACSFSTTTRAAAGLAGTAAGYAGGDERVAVAGSKLLYPTGPFQHAGMALMEADGSGRVTFETSIAAPRRTRAGWTESGISRWSPAPAF